MTALKGSEEEQGQGQYPVASTTFPEIICQGKEGEKQGRTSRLFLSAPFSHVRRDRTEKFRFLLSCSFQCPLDRTPFFPPFSLAGSWPRLWKKNLLRTYISIYRYTFSSWQWHGPVVPLNYPGSDKVKRCLKAALCFCALISPYCRCFRSWSGGPRSLRFVHCSDFFLSSFFFFFF